MVINILIIIMIMMMMMWTADSSKGDGLTDKGPWSDRELELKLYPPWDRVFSEHPIDCSQRVSSTATDRVRITLEILLLIGRPFNQLPSKLVGTDNKFQFYSFDLNIPSRPFIWPITTFITC